MKIPGVRIILDRRIHEEDDRHIDLLTRLKRLLIEAEALDFLEVFADGVRSNVVHGLSLDRAGARVLRSIVDLGLRPRSNIHIILLGLEPPRQSRVHIRVELDLELTGDGARCLVSAECRPIVACCLAEGSIEAGT